uniref:Uncharacterized protein n=1 Tax=Entamoeba invadens TaxID=33085 RepID=S0AYM7_ENTIV|nr:hypothetical protein, conserved [Entamoeba invadens]
MLFLLIICASVRAFPYTNEQTAIIAKKITEIGAHLVNANEEVKNHKAEIDALMTKISKSSIDFAAANDQLSQLNMNILSLVRTDALETKAPVGDSLVDLDELYDGKKAKVVKKVSKKVAKKQQKKAKKVAQKAQAKKIAKKENKKATKKAEKKVMKKQAKKAQKKLLNPAKLNTSTKKEKKVVKVAKSSPKQPTGKTTSAQKAQAKEAGIEAYRKVMRKYKAKISKEAHQAAKEGKDAKHSTAVIKIAKKAKKNLEKAKEEAKEAYRNAFRKTLKGMRKGHPCKPTTVIVTPVELVFPFSTIPQIRRAQIYMNNNWVKTCMKAWSLN